MLGKSVRGGIQVVPVVRIGRRTAGQCMVRWRPRHFQWFQSCPGIGTLPDGRQNALLRPHLQGSAGHGPGRQEGGGQRDTWTNQLPAVQPEPMDMLLDAKGRKIATADELAETIGVDASNIRNWARLGELKQLVESPRRVFYYVDEVTALNREKIDRRKKRGGRPRKKGTAA